MDNREKHDIIRNYIEIVRQYDIYHDLMLDDKLVRIAMDMTYLPIIYGHGGRIKPHLKETYYTANIGGGNEDHPPGLECAGFMEAILYAAGLLRANQNIFNYRSLRHIPEDSKVYLTARDDIEGYSVNWIPSKTRTTILQDAGICGAWAQTVHLLYFRTEFEPVHHLEPRKGDFVFFMSMDAKGEYHYHVGIWAIIRNAAGGIDEGLIHSSPPTQWDRRSGPKFTSRQSEYYDWLGPQRRMWSEWFGTAGTVWNAT